jgi:hypothetical protein
MRSAPYTNVVYDCLSSYEYCVRGNMEVYQCADVDGDASSKRNYLMLGQGQLMASSGPAQGGSAIAQAAYL